MIDSNSPINWRNSNRAPCSYSSREEKDRRRKKKEKKKKLGLVENRRGSQSPACHIWDLGTCPAQVTRSRWYPWQVDGSTTEHPVNQRPWKRVTQRAPLTLSRSRIKVPYERAAWITNNKLKKHEKMERSVRLSFDRRFRSRTKREDFFLFFSSLFSSSPLAPSNCLSFTRGSFSRKVDSRRSKVAVSRWIICELKPLSVRVSEVSMAELSCSNTTLPSREIGEVEIVRVWREDRGCWSCSLYEWLASWRGTRGTEFQRRTSVWSN